MRGKFIVGASMAILMGSFAATSARADCDSVCQNQLIGQITNGQAQSVGGVLSFRNNFINDFTKNPSNAGRNPLLGFGAFVLNNTNVGTVLLGQISTRNPGLFQSLQAVFTRAGYPIK